MNRREFMTATSGAILGVTTPWQPSIDMVVRGGRVVLPDGTVRADILVHDGKIVALGAPPVVPPARTVLDAEGMLILPGLIDSHVHFRTPFRGAVTQEDFYAGSRAAAFGGVTTYIDFAFQPKGRDLLSVIAERRAEADPHTVLDYALHVVVTDPTPPVLEQIGEVIAAGLPSIKVFMAFDQEGLRINDGALLAIMHRVARHNGIIAVHTENNDIVEHLTEEYTRSGKIVAAYYPETRPRYAEHEAIRRALFLARLAGVRYYGFHLTIAEGVEEFRQARRAGLPVFTETCTHYLVLTEEVYRRPDGVNYVCSPPLRTAADVEALWRGLQEGVISAVTSDHTAWSLAQKQLGQGSYLHIPHGMPGVELRLPMLYTEGVLTGRLSLPQLVDLLSTSLAKIWGLYPQKGSLLPGADADLVIFDPDAQWTVAPEHLHMRADWSPYTGRVLRGRVVSVIARGDVVIDRGVFRGEPGRGRFLQRKLSEERT
jgi:dihydropyrimidinase